MDNFEICPFTRFLHLISRRLTIAQCVSWKNPFFRVSVLDKRVFPRLGFKKPPIRLIRFALPMPVVSEVRGAAIWTSRESALRPTQKRLKSSIAHEGIKPPSTPKFLMGKGLHIERNFIETLAYIVFSCDKQIISGPNQPKGRKGPMGIIVTLISSSGFGSYLHVDMKPIFDLLL